MSDTRDMSPGDRRELRSLVKKQFAVLRKDVKRREDEMKGEIESELLRRYQAQDEAIMQARREAMEATRDYKRAVQAIADSLAAGHPELTVEVRSDYSSGGCLGIAAGDQNRAQLHRVLIAAIPQQVAEAGTRLDQDELNLLRDLTIGALDTDQAQRFLSAIPTVGQLVPTARLAQIEAQP